MDDLDRSLDCDTGIDLDDHAIGHEGRVQPDGRIALDTDGLAELGRPGSPVTKALASETIERPAGKSRRSDRSSLR